MIAVNLLISLIQIITNYFSHPEESLNVFNLTFSTIYAV